MDEDPELYEIMIDQICKQIGKFKIDQILTMLANLQHSLSPSVIEVYKVVNAEFTNRLQDSYASQNNELYIQTDDIIKIMTLLLDHNQMTDDLKQSIINYFDSNLSSFNYEILAELAVLHAAK